MRERKPVYCLWHYYEFKVEKLEICLERVSGDVDPVRAAVYCQFKAEEWFAKDVSLQTFGIAAALIAFYGFKRIPYCWAAAKNDRRFVDIELYEERDALCDPDSYTELVNDPTLFREGLKEFLYPYTELYTA